MDVIIVLLCSLIAIWQRDDPALLTHLLLMVIGAVQMTMSPGLGLHELRMNVIIALLCSLRDVPAGEVRLRPKPPSGECASNVGLSNCWSHFENMLLKIFKDAGGKQHFGQVSKGSLEQLLDGQGA